MLQITKGKIDDSVKSALNQSQILLKHNKVSIRKLRLTQLLIKYRNNDLSRAEYDEFVNLIEQEGIEKILEPIVDEDWSESEEILNQIELASDRKIIKPFYHIKWIGVSVAASIMLMVSYYFHTEKKVAEVITYQTAYGETKSIWLPDSSKVLLNANTKLSWESDWKEKGVRSVKLDGEAFFEVRKSKGIEFTVESGSTKVKVLGTVFNVRNRRGLTDVFLESGKIDLELDVYNKKTVSMEPGTSVHYDDQRRDIIVKKESTLTHSASWVDGMLEFQNESLIDILNNFEELYGKRFQIENKALLNKRMDLSLPYANWELIRKALEISLDVEFVENNGIIIVT